MYGHLHIASLALLSLDFEINDVRVRVTKSSARIAVHNVHATNQDGVRIKTLDSANNSMNYLC